MRFGINTLLFTSPFTNKETRLFPTFKKWGFDSVELAIEDPDHIDPAFVKSELDKAGLVCGSYCGMFGPDRDLRGDARQQNTCMKYVMRAIDQMVILDSPSLIGPIYSAVGRADAVPKDESARQWKTVVKNLKVLARYAQKNGKQICLEPLNRFETDFINTCERGLKMIHDVGSPALRLQLDTFHMNIEEKFLGEAVLKAGKHLAHLHACGSDRGTPGGDHTDWTSIAKALKKINYQGDVVIESFIPDIKVVAKAASIWRKIEPSPEDIPVNGLKFLKRLLK
jgi:D-psicose/D-tagatose/L-ribulose 3-epimerase